MVMAGRPFVIEKKQIDESVDIIKTTLARMEKIVP
jgi:hypothetical protein